MTRPNWVRTLYAYDNLSHLTSVLHQLSGSTVDGAAYTLDNAGNRTAKTDERAGVTSNFSYDAIYELTQVTQGSNTTESYSFDPVGNRTASLGVSSYTTNSSNELTSTSNATYTYDYNGNMLTSTTGSNTTTYAWDFQNRLASATLPGSGGTITFAYDPFGRRIKKVTPSTTSIFAYDGDGNLVEETNAAGTAVARYAQTTDSVDEPVAMLRGGTTSYYDADGLGSITSLSNPSGTIVQNYTFDSFGNPTASSGSITNPFQYTAREFDPETSLYYYRARYYSPAVGRFISEDPAGFSSDTFNFYGYVSSNPLVFSDPSGLWKFHGNWCGPNWTGGHIEPYIPKHDDIPGYYAPGIDYVDVPCSNHDKCYSKCRDKHPCSPLARSACERKCDFGLIGGIIGHPFKRVLNPTANDPNHLSVPNILNPWSYVIGTFFTLDFLPLPGPNGDANSYDPYTLPKSSCCGNPPAKGAGSH